MHDTIGVIGLGLLGGAIAERLLWAGYGVVGYDRDVTRQAFFRSQGGTPLDSPAEVAARARRLVISLPTSADVAQVVEQIGQTIAPGRVLLDTTTGLPRDAAALGGQLAERGIDYLDATVSGSSADVRAGAAVVMAGGRRAAFEASVDIFAAFSKTWTLVGGSGAGSAMKLVSNLVLGLNRAALAEGLTLARALDLDAVAALDVLKQGAAYSRAMDAKGDKMVSGDFTPQARLAQHLKDVRLMLEAAGETGLDLPLSQLHRDLLDRCVAAGYGDEDNSAIIKAFGVPGP